MQIQKLKLGQQNNDEGSINLAGAIKKTTLKGKKIIIKTLAKLYKSTLAIRTTVVPIRILIRTTVVPIRILIRTTVVPIRILIRTTGMTNSLC